MASLFLDKGVYKVRYCVHFMDNTSLNKIKVFKSGGRARLALREIERLEEMSEKRELTVRDVAYFIYKKFITADEAHSLTTGKVSRLSPFELPYEGDQFRLEEAVGARRFT